MQRWIGRWLFAVGVLHNALGVYMYTIPLAAMISTGVWNSTGMDPARSLAFWFIISGLLMMLVGYMVDWAETSGRTPFPSGLAPSLLALTALGIVVMPVSGFWAILPAVYGCFRRQQHGLASG
ncbi:MAG: hypothetical protein KY464_18920 [Gemmatimonadetes bacterium]|nr:hypothetical protein [Gemmatimonadota bacterium]